MNLFTVDFQSYSLHKQTTVHVLCPQEVDRASGFPSLLLLHGMTDDQGWIRHSLVENYAQKQGVCLVIPNADLSFYTDMAYGGDYLTFLAEELPDFFGNYFPMVNMRKNRFVAGNSMGGYGAFLLAMRYPQMFSAAFSLSGPMKISWIYRILSDKKLTEVFASGDTDKLELTVRQIAADERIPDLLINSLVDLYAFCGKQDYHYESNLLFSEIVRPLGINYQLRTGKGGHDWDYWNGQLPELFEIIGNYPV